MASQLRGKLAARGNRSLHHGETHNTISFEYFDEWLNGHRNNNANVNSLRDNQQSTILEEHEMRKYHPICEKILDTLLKEETKNHEVENQLPQGDCREEHKEEGEYNNTILTNGVCSNQRESIDGSLNYEGVPTNGWSQLYVGDIDIRFESVSTSPSFHKHEDEDLVEDNEEPRSTSPSPLELQEVDQIKKKEEEEVHSHEPSFIEGYLKMSEMDINESLSILYDTKSLVSDSLFKFSSLEEQSFLEYMKKIQRAMCNIKGNFMSLILNIKNLIELSEWL